MPSKGNSAEEIEHVRAEREGAFDEIMGNVAAWPAPQLTPTTAASPPLPCPPEVQLMQSKPTPAHNQGMATPATSMQKPRYSNLPPPPILPTPPILPSKHAPSSKDFSREQQTRSMDNGTLGSESTTPCLKNLRPKRSGDYGTLCIMTIRPSKEKDASPSARVFAAIKFAFGLFFQVDPATQFLPIYDDDDEVGSNSMVPISASSSFPGGLLKLSNHAQVSNSWGLAPVWGSDKDGKPKKQPSVFVHIKIHTKFEIE